MSEWMSLETPSGRIRAWLAKPHVPPRGALVVVQEIFGVNKHIRAVCTTFAEHGYDSEGFIQKPQLPAAIKPYARQWVEAGKPMSEFFAQNPELGAADQYNLVEFMQVKE